MATGSQRNYQYEDFEKTLSHDKFSLRRTEQERIQEDQWLSQRFLRSSINGEGGEEYENLDGKPKVEQKTGVFMSAFNLMNDVVTVSCVSMPYYFQSSGVPFTLLMLFFFAILNSWTLFVIYNIKQKLSSSNDFMVMNDLTIGKVGVVITCIASFCYNYGAFISQLLLMADVLPDLLNEIFGEHDIFSNRLVLLGGAIALFSPFAFLRNIAQYAIISFASFVSLSVLIGTVTVKGLIYIISDGYGPNPNPITEWHFWQPAGILTSFGGFAYVFTCHDLSVSVIDSMDRPTRPRYEISIYFMMSVAVIWLSSIGIGGNLEFPTNVQVNILDNYSSTDDWANVARFFLAVSVIVSVPYTCFMPRVAICKIIDLIFEVAKRPELTKKFEMLIHVLVTSSLLICALTISYFVTNLGAVYSLVGGVAGVTLSLILPSVIGFTVTESRPLRIVHVIVGVFGVISAILTVISVFATA